MTGGYILDAEITWKLYEDRTMPAVGIFACVRCIFDDARVMIGDAFACGTESDDILWEKENGKVHQKV
jgi:hypothetical protein